jgi:hypothetical protein
MYSQALSPDPAKPPPKRLLQALANEFRIQFFETSAKNNTNVSEVFHTSRLF